MNLPKSTDCLYAKVISKKIKSVKRDNQKKGLFIGWKPLYGYKSHPDTTNELIIDEATAPIVKKIFGMASSGDNCRKIAGSLNEELVPTYATYAEFSVGNPGPYTDL